MEKLLCIKIASRGDLLLAAPAFRVLRTMRPEAHITLLVGASCEDVAQHLPYFDRIQTIDDQALMGGGRRNRFVEAWRMLGRIRSRDPGQALFYSEAFIFHRDWRYGLLAWLSGIPVRRGLQRGERPLFLTHPYRADDREHHVRQYLSVISSRTDDFPLAGLWKFKEGERERALATARAHGFKPESGSWIGLGFGGGRNIKTRTELKTWPLERFCRLAEQLVKHGRQVVWIGDAEDADMLGDAPEGAPPPQEAVNLSGKLSVTETAAVLSACQLVVSNDSLALHLAEALGVSTIGLFGPTDPMHYRPLGRRSTYLWPGRNLSCSPCHRDGYFPPCTHQHRCMRELPVESVLENFFGHHGP